MRNVGNAAAERLHTKEAFRFSFHQQPRYVRAKRAHVQRLNKTCHVAWLRLRSATGSVTFSNAGHVVTRRTLFAIWTTLSVTARRRGRERILQ